MRRLPATLLFLFFASCTGSDISKPIPQEATDSAETLAAVKVKKEIDCCWCTTRADGRNEVRVYPGEELCEEASNKGINLRCKKIRAIGNQCVLATRRIGSKGKVECAPVPLKYIENGETKEVAPPGDVAMVCAAGEWFDVPLTARKKNQDPTQPLAPGEQAEEEEEKDDIFCGCGRDVSNGLNCGAYRSVNGSLTLLDSKPIPPGDSGCQRSTCEKIWNFEQFQNVCPPRFVQLTP